MHVREIDIIGEPLNQVADVDNEGAVDRRALYPVALPVHDLKTADVVLRQDGQVAVVRMRSDTDDVFPDMTMLRRVVEQALNADRLRIRPWK